MLVASETRRILTGSGVVDLHRLARDMRLMAPARECQSTWLLGLVFLVDPLRFELRAYRL